MNSDELLYRLAFAGIRGNTLCLARELLRLCGSEQQFFDMPETQLRYLTQSRSAIYSREYRDKKLEAARQELRFIEAHNVRPLYFTDAEYPQRLTECDDAPVLLHTLGHTDLNNSRIISIVGTRHATIYGIDFTRKLVEEIAEKVENPVIASGLAYGIDIEAHRAAMRVGIPTVAVMATGITSIYPADHRSTAADMLKKGGMLLTEYTSQESIHKGNFVARNRIVAGMSDCLVVSESAEKGGALITAKLAFDYNREVFALPGRLSDRYSAGCNRLIASDMAQLTLGADSICKAMNWTIKPSTEHQPQLPMPMNSDEELIVKYLTDNQDARLEAITAATGFPVSKLMSMLIDMEFRGLVSALPGARYRCL